VVRHPPVNQEFSGLNPTGSYLLYIYRRRRHAELNSACRRRLYMAAMYIYVCKIIAFVNFDEIKKILLYYYYEQR